MKADVKSSGIAAPVAQPHQHGELGISLASYSDDLKNGANNFFQMLQQVKKIGNETAERLGEDVDGTDYKAIAFNVETAIYANLLGCSKANREGFLRAFSDFLITVASGFTPNENWGATDALEATSMAYATEGAAA